MIANAIYASLIIYYSSTHYLFTYLFSHQHIFFPLWMVDANFIFILVLISSYFRSVWHPFGCLILCMVYLNSSYFIYFVLVSLYTFSSHIVTTFFFSSSCTRNLAPKSQCCKYTLTEPHAPTIHEHSTANDFSGPNY